MITVARIPRLIHAEKRGRRSLILTGDRFRMEAIYTLESQPDKWDASGAPDLYLFNIVRLQDAKRKADRNPEYLKLVFCGVVMLV